MDPQVFAGAFAAAIVAADAKQPAAKRWKPGLGPHDEDEQVGLAVTHLTSSLDGIAAERAVPYPNSPRQKCDLALRFESGERWFVEAKLFRPAGDNGKLNDQNIGHLLSPYDADRSALTDCRKLRLSGFEGRKFILVIAYHWDARPFAPARAAFETLAAAEGPIGPRYEAPFSDLVHPHHASGCVAMWEVL